MSQKTRIAHLAGATATIQNTPPLVTSNKARAKHGLPLMEGADGSPPVFDALRAQRLAAPVKLYVEQFSAHPMEADAAELHGPPAGHGGIIGQFSHTGHLENQGASNSERPMFTITEASGSRTEGTSPRMPVRRQRVESYWSNGQRRIQFSISRHSLFGS